VTPVTEVNRKRSAISVLSAAAVVTGLGTPALASSPEERQREVEEQIEEQRSDLWHSTKDMQEATEAYEQATAQLPAAEEALAKAKSAEGEAQQELTRAQNRVNEAKQADEQAAADLAAAEQAVEEQLVKIEEVSAEIESQRGSMSSVATQAYQTGATGNLDNLAQVFQADSLADAASSMAYSRSVMDAQDQVIDAAETTRAELANRRVVLDDLEAEAETLRTQAAQRLDETKQLETAAQQARDEAADTRAQREQAKAEVDELVASRDAARVAAEEAQAADRQEYEELKAERDEINEDIRELERERQEKERREREERDDSSGGSSAGSGSSGGGSSDGGTSEAGLAWPISDPQITSSYGMRVHPVTGIYKLHDGTDFRARCGVPIRAAYGGTVRWATYRGGYGNQVAINHGVVEDRGTVTSYSHLSRFAVNSGDWVGRGEVIGYSGTTGSSTGCHLHLMMWRGGEMVNPMSVLD